MSLAWVKKKCKKYSQMKAFFLATLLLLSKNGAALIFAKDFCQLFFSIQPRQQQQSS
jgi:hypothetical protein